MSTLHNFGVPLGGGAGRGGILQPKAKNRFRVRVFGFGPIAGGLELTQQVITCGRPQWNANPVEAHSYNSTAYFTGKVQWQPLSMTVRDDVTNSVSRLIGHQVQKEMNHFEQTTTLAGQNYKFETYIEHMDGGNDVVLEQWFLEGCMLESVNWGDLDMSTGESVTIELGLRFDNATQSGGLMPLIPEFRSGVMV